MHAICMHNEISEGLCVCGGGGGGGAYIAL